MTLVADENLEPIIPHLVMDFERLNPEAKINIRYKPTRNSLTDLLNKDVNNIIVAGDFNEEDKKYIAEYKIELKRYEVAIDAVAFIVNTENPVVRLTSDDLKKIFTGEYTQWSQIKVQDEEQNTEVINKMKDSYNKIKVFIQRPNSSTWSYVKDTLLSGTNYIQSAEICSTSTQMLEMIRSTKNGIGISNLCWLSRGEQDLLDTTVRAIRISRIYPNGRQDDFTQLHQGLVFTKKYPYIRKIIVYTSDLDIRLSTGWITYLLNKDGQKTFLERGLVPVNQPVQVIKLE